MAVLGLQQAMWAEEARESAHQVPVGFRMLPLDLSASAPPSLLAPCAWSDARAVASVLAGCFPAACYSALRSGHGSVACEACSQAH